MKTKKTTLIMLIISMIISNQLFAHEQHLEASPEVGVNKFLILLIAAGILLGYYKLVHQKNNIQMP